MRNWTPGPWTIDTATMGDVICTIHGVPPQPTEDGKLQEWVYVNPPRVIDGKWHYKDEQQNIANARLIAAAPEMAEMLRAFTDHYPSGINPWLDASYGEARILLARIEGDVP